MYFPSGAHTGWLTTLKVSLVSCFASVPSARMIQRLDVPSLSLAYAIHCPSGEKRGCRSHARPPASSAASPPVAGTA